MSEEEKKAIDKLKRSANYFVMPIHETTIILNLIEKQQKEIERMKSLDIYKIVEEVETGNVISKDKIQEILDKAKYEEYFKNLGKFYARIYLNFVEGFNSEIRRKSHENR